MKTKKKFPRIAIVTIILATISITLLGISIITSTLSVKRTEKAIKDIGEVSYTVEVEEKIDLAISYFDKLDTNIGLDKNVSNKDDLEAAKKNYVRLAIKKAVFSYNRRVVDEISEDDLKLYVNDAYAKLKKYFDETKYEEIEGYEEFKPLLDIYKEEEKTDNTNPSEGGSGAAEEPEIC